MYKGIHTSVMTAWVIKGIGMSSRVCATGHRPIKDPLPLIEERRGLSPGGRFPPRFPTGRKTSSQPQTIYTSVLHRDVLGAIQRMTNIK